ncbi:MAG: GTPase [Microcystis aeruginosa W13-15]|jgi:flagellar capping protein FliD|nr:GTPase [Microcystis aeruginosa W13-16]NCQ75230.1 GTPase [Microcystis aeruginosa W13-13]NCQ78828.1 GTPase [Microcystis aeruginosa W13-15]NCS51244.1 GTPase [Microcystis aeruginosa G13-05]NCT42237.1 GTPase [Microcystis aeruginosa G11-09]
MGQKSYEVFQAVENKANLLAGYWGDFKTEIIQHLPESYHGEIHELSSNLEKALEVLINELRHPTLILATTGTTSSGKSTLVNLLCGADIVPMAQREMSAGTVTIEYSEEKTLIIEETPGALWECGKWEKISDEDIYSRLKQLMKAYIKARKKQPDLAYPRSIIYYPFRLVKDESFLELPKGVRVKLLDLPGFSYVGDEGNLGIIKQCREALCLVTYNSAETDPYKVDNLLSEVVNQVKDLGGSPARMLFILNRIDIFRSDDDWQESEGEFIEETTENIKEKLIENLREYTKDIENLRIVKLSTWPALLALQIQDNKKLLQELLEELPTREENWSEHDQTRLEKVLKPYEQAIDNFQVLIKEMMKRGNLSLDPKQWTISQQEQIAKELFKQSYAEEFEDKLSKHIAEHFPKLVIPQALEKFNVAAGNSIAQWAVQTTTAILNSSEENYQQEIEKISWIKSSLAQFLQVSDANLRKPFEKIKQNCEEYLNQQTEDDPLSILTEAITDLQFTEPYNEIEEKLVPLYDWRNALGRGVDQILEAVAESLENGIVTLDHPNFKKANIVNVNLLEGNLRRLIKLGYSYYFAKNGQNVVAKTQEEKENLKQKNYELNELSIHLSLIIAQVLDKISTQEIQRMYEAVNELFICHLAYLEKGSNERAPDIVIRFPESELNKVTNDLKFDFVRLDSDFEIKEEQYTEKCRTWKHWLWIVPKKEKRSSENAKIPSIGQILADWKKQLKEVEPEMLKQVIEWLLAQIDDLKKSVDKTQNDILDQYRDRLEKARQEITFDYEKQQNVWQPMQQRAKRLEEEFSRLGNFEKEADSSGS